MNKAAGDNVRERRLLTLNLTNEEGGPPAAFLRLSCFPIRPRHPSEDIDITGRLVAASRILGINLADHIIIGKPGDLHPGYISLREKGLVSFG